MGDTCRGKRKSACLSSYSHLGILQPLTRYKENLKKVLGIEGAATLSPSGFSSDNIDITFDTPLDGKARFTVSPPADAGNSFFMRVKVK